MDAGWLHRLRWRHRGAWLWPTFALLTAAEIWIGHSLPPAGESQSLAGAAILALVLNILAVLLLSRPLGAAIRRARADLPHVVARDLGGRIGLVLVAATLLAIGLAHRSAIIAHSRAMHDAIERAQAWIGDRAPAEFRRNVAFVSTYAIVPGRVYRTCVRGDTSGRTFCVIVDTHLPFARSVSFAGYESNAVFAQGAN